MSSIKTTEEFNSRIKQVIITKEQIDEAVRKAGADISAEYEGRPLLLVSILKGAYVFMADLCRAVSIPCEIGFMAAKSYYEGTESSGKVKITLDLSQDISQYHVIIVEDIIDTGRTLNDIIKMLKARNPLSLKVLTLLDKLPGIIKSLRDMSPLNFYNQTLNSSCPIDHDHGHMDEDEE